MRLTDNGKICAVNAKEQARLIKWREAHKRKGGGKDERKNTAKQCIMRILKETAKRLCEDVEQTIETEAEHDIDCFYQKEQIKNMWNGPKKECEENDET